MKALLIALLFAGLAFGQVRHEVCYVKTAKILVLPVLPTTEP